MNRPAGRAVAALRGAVGFLTRLPVGRDERAWRAFRATPAAFPLAGYLVGALVALPFVAAPFLPAATVAFAYVVAVYAVTGINHVDGVADLGDAAVVHGDAAERREVMRDTTVGVGAALAVGGVLLGLGLGALALAAAPVRAAAAVVVATEVGAKAGMAAVACVGTATHEGLGSALTRNAAPRSFALPALLSAPAALLAWPGVAPAAALGGALAAGAAVVGWARAALGGVSGDAFGAVNEVGRVAGLHAGVIAWTLS
ncbi:adenosylcobinamide-GDP ribazoletransferase [Halostella litorea]|uniref:adenosylcobinamide-GDP ribazoletransferase n=1 Tax=Halostella litorea TaxID=2528831 RepID=UPI0010921EEF|nr:adenosylcobinamide-GDP ribazoletransferase [Halostella litorea]